MTKATAGRGFSASHVTRGALRLERAERREPQTNF
jgi:hypothetical protein